MSKRAEQVGANEVGYAGWQEGHALLPATRAHRVHHPDRQRGLQHRYAGVCERYSSCERKGVSRKFLENILQYSKLIFSKWGACLHKNCGVT